MARCSCSDTPPSTLIVQEGPISDASFGPVKPPIGTMILDPTPGIIYVRVAVGSWKTVTLV